MESSLLMLNHFVSEGKIPTATLPNRKSREKEVFSRLFGHHKTNRGTARRYSSSQNAYEVS
jgi:hypothetical protein